jgi:hypothetical protein
LTLEVVVNGPVSLGGDRRVSTQKERERNCEEPMELGRTKVLETASQTKKLNFKGV